MDKLTIGIMAHVDAGKTTLCEAMLYESGQLRRLGRVDHKDAFLDTDAQERDRGITIFSKQALLRLPELTLQLLDTPGHVDFSAEMERTLSVLDYAILVISGTDGIQSHTRTLRRLLERYRIPTFVFINKMDLEGRGKEALLRELQEKLHNGCVDFTDEENLQEAVAGCDEGLIERFFAHGTLEREDIADAVFSGKVIPCYFGSALHLDSVQQLLSGLQMYTKSPSYPAEFGARVFKISRDNLGNRLTHLKITGGSLSVRDTVTMGQTQEKIHQIRCYSGAKFTIAESVNAGTICTVTGLTFTAPGQGLGADCGAVLPILEPVMSYCLRLPEDVDPQSAYGKLQQLQDEDPLLRLVWQERSRSIHLQLMGEVQMEVLQRLIGERFGWSVSFGEGSILYRETITDCVEGIGHFEPLRHYAEVHLLLSPAERGSGITVDAACPTDTLALHWQRLIETHLTEKEHPGVLTGSPITDVRITILSGRAHEKHTEGGDFRQATYRAVRHGLMQAQTVLLEPWYRFRMELPVGAVGRAITDLQRMNGEVDTPENCGDMAILCGSVPVSAFRGYAAELAAYTRGEGHLSCELSGYAPCPEQESVAAAIEYDAERDTENPADSVFCSHGAAVIIPWREVEAHAHLPSLRQSKKDNTIMKESFTVRSATRNISFEQDKELQMIYERTYGTGKAHSFVPQQEIRRREASVSAAHTDIRVQEPVPEYLLVDGYNIIFAWEELKTLAKNSLEDARNALQELLCNYQGYRKNHVIVVFDAYKVPRREETVLQYRNITVVFTKEKQTADSYIEKTTYEIAGKYNVRVATSDGAEQMIILGHGALRIPASQLKEEVELAQGQIRAFLEQNNRRKNTELVRKAVEKAREQKNETEKNASCIPPKHA